MTTTQWIGWTLYLLMAAISIWATGESLARSFKIPLFVAYLMGLVIAGSCAAFLSIIKAGNKEKAIGKIILAGLAFLLVWFISLLTNTHQFYLVGTLEKIQQDELVDAQNQIENMRNSALQVFDQSVRNFQSRAKNYNSSLRAEIINEGRPGLGPKATKIIIDLGQLLEMNVNGLDATGTSQAAIRNLAQRQSNYVDGLIKQRVDAFAAPRHEIAMYFSSSEDEEILNKIKRAIEDFEAISPKEVSAVLKDAHAYYARTIDYIAERVKMLPDYKQSNIAEYRSKLSEKPASVELEHIANSYSYVKKNRGFNQPRFRMAFAIAFAVDIAAFIIFFFMALPNNKSEY